LRLREAAGGDTPRVVEPAFSDMTGFLAPSARPGMNLSRRVQALRLLRRGEDLGHIAAALGVPRNEVELVVRIHRITGQITGQITGGPVATAASPPAGVTQRLGSQPVSKPVPGSVPGPVFRPMYKPIYKEGASLGSTAGSQPMQPPPPAVAGPV